MCSSVSLADNTGCNLYLLLLQSGEDILLGTVHSSSLTAVEKSLSVSISQPKLGKWILIVLC